MKRKYADDDEVWATSRLELVFAWNINGLSSKLLGKNLQNLDCKNMINSFDFVILSETWKKVTVEVNGYKIVTTDTLKTGKCGRNSGGLALLYKLKFDDWISVQKESPNFLWFKISNRYTKTTKDIYVCGTYIPPYNSRYFRPELFEELESDIREILLPWFNSYYGRF